MAKYKKKSVLIQRDDNGNLLSSTTTFSYSRKKGLFGYLSIFCLIIILSCTFFTGTLDTSYSNNTKTNLYSDYTGEVQSITFVNYDWRKKINQLSRLVNVFDNPLLVVNNNILCTQENKEIFTQVYDYGLLSYNGDSEEYYIQHIGIINTRVKVYYKSWTFHYDLINSNNSLDNFYYSWWESIGTFINQYFELDSNGDIRTLLVYNETEDFSLADIVNVFISPFRWAYNFIYDLGVLFGFVIVW